MAAREIADRLGLAALHAEQIGGARHVDVEEGAAHQEIGSLGRHVLGQLGKALGGDHARQAALAPAAHQVGHRRERGAAHLLCHFAASRRREQLGLVHHHQRRIPMVARRIEQRIQESGGAFHLPLGFQPLQAEHHRSPVLPNPRGEARDLAFRIVGRLDGDMAVFVAERDEVALGVDHHLLDMAGAPLEQPAQQVRLARPRIALDEQSRRQQLLEIHGDGITLAVHPHVHAHRHRRTLWPMAVAGGSSVRRKAVGGMRSRRRAALAVSRRVADSRRATGRRWTCEHGLRGRSSPHCCCRRPRRPRR